MKTKKRIALCLLCLLGITSCEKDKLSYAPSEIFDVELFRMNIEDQLTNALGYAIVINQNGMVAESNAFGMGATNASSGAVINASIQHDINIASVTKPLTAMAVIKLMQDRGQLLNFPIGIWLPTSWTKSTAMSNITFQELLTHTSGIRQSNTSWNSLKATVAGPLEGPKTYAYSNVNFALFRAILPKLNDVLTFNNNENSMGVTTFENWMSNNYISVMQQQVFTPADIQNAICNVSPGVTTMQAFNELNNPPLNPRNAGDWTQTCGGGGYYLSTLEMAKVMAYLVHTENILSNAQKTTMDNNLLGWDPNDSFASTKGQVYGKDGALFWDLNSDGNPNAGESGLQTWVGKFPNNVEVALSITSIGNGFRGISGIMQTAYENAWVEE